MALQFNPQGMVARMLQSAQRIADSMASPPGGPRMGAYGEQHMLSVVPDMHNLADEGSYFVANNAQTGLATAAAPTAFSATNPFLLIYNKDTQPNGKRIYVDYMGLVVTAIGTAGANVQFAVTLDSGNRYSSGGSEITGNISNPNYDAPLNSIAKVYAGNITALAAGTAVRTIVGNRFAKAAIPVVGDTFMIKCGAVDALAQIGASTAVFSSQNIPPLVIGPGQCALLHLWLASQSAASSYLPELGWWER